MRRGTLQAGHLLLGRPWQFDRRAQHNGYDKYSFTHKHQSIVLRPLSPREVFEDQLRMQKSSEMEREGEEPERKPMHYERKIERKKECKPSAKQNLFATKSDIKRAITEKQPMVLLIHRGTVLNTNMPDLVLPCLVVSLLQDFADVIPKDLPKGLTPIRGIENQIDLVPKATLPS